jgi:cytochrome c-type biogenesis protein CcmH
MKSKRFLQIFGLALVVVLLMGADSNQRFDKLGHRMMCQCGCNQILLECNHVGCTTSEKMRGELKDAIAGVQSPGGPQNPSAPRGGAPLQASANDDDILQMFVQKYGPVVLAAPTTTGFNRVAWIFPYVALLLGFGLVAMVMKKWMARQRPVAVTSSGSLNAEQLDEFRRRARQETEV